MIGEPAIEPLVSVIEYEKSGYDVKRECFRALVRIEPKGRTRAGGMVSHPDVRVRRALAVALGFGEAGFALPMLKNLCADPDWEVRDRATQSLGNLDSPGALPVLLGQLQDSDQHVRAAAVMSLGALKDPGALGTLVKLLNDEPSEHLRKLAAQSLRQITGLDYGNDPEKWRQWWEARRK
jgi:HEAT repeat protein